MDIVSFILATNKITLVAFIVTLGVLIYEVRHLLTEKKNSKSAPVIPSFNPNQTEQPVISATPLVAKEKDIKKNPYFHRIVFVILVIMLLLFGFLTFSSMFNQQQTPVDKPEAQVALQEVQSSGIKIYDSNWQEIVGNDTDKVGPGNTIFVGIAMVKGSDITKARIKVNSQEWSADDVTTDFNNQYNVFYKRYIINETDHQLKIEAQLFSTSKGWLSD